MGYTFLRDNTLRVLSIKNEDNKFLFDNILKYRIVISISLFWVCTFCSFYTQLKWKIIMCAYKNVFVYLFIRKFHFMWVIYLIEYVVCILLKPRHRPSSRGRGSSRPSTSTSPSSLNWPSQQPALYFSLCVPHILFIQTGWQCRKLNKDTFTWSHLIF